MRQIVAAAALSLACVISVHAAKDEENAAQKAELQQKINEYREKTSKVTEKITATREEAQSETRAHERYKENFTAELERLEKEKSELKAEQERLARSSDSLARKISSIQRNSNEITLKQTQFRNSLIEAIDSYKSVVDETPAPVLTKESESLTFLKKELSSGAISNIEATERLWQIISTVNKNRLTVDVWSAPSTWEGITGQSHFLRIGYGYIAMVNDGSTAGAVWNGSEWAPITAMSELTALRTAVKIRNGNTLPEIMSLPFPELTAEEVSDDQ